MLGIEQRTDRFSHLSRWVYKRNSCCVILRSNANWLLTALKWHLEKSSSTCCAMNIESID